MKKHEITFTIKPDFYPNWGEKYKTTSAFVFSLECIKLNIN